jgi:aspartate/methionine/tyrosine aminotransferase
MSLEPFLLERYLSVREFRARRTLSSSDCESLAMAELVGGAGGAARAMWDELRLGYTEPAGHPLLRRAIAGLYRGLADDEVTAVVPEEGIFLAMHALLRPGDHVVVTFPGYQSLYSIARSLGCRVSSWWPDESRGWRFDPDRLRAILAEAGGAAGIVINFPHNPTGALPTAAEMAEIVDIAARAGAWLFSDEMYRTLEHDPADRLPSAVEIAERSIALGGLSKSLGAPGLRVGWLAARDRRLLARVAELKDYTTICGAGPSEVLALMVLDARERITERNLGIVRRNLDALDALLARQPGLLGWTRPRAASVGLARLPGDEPASRLCQELLDQTGLLLLPSSVFEFGERHVRLGFGRADFAEALDELAPWLRARLGSGA